MALGQGTLGKRLESWAFPKERYPGRGCILMEWIRHDLNPGAIVLDCGAGKGKTRYSLGDKVHKIVGIDLSDEVLANPLLDEAHVCDACDTPFSDDTFDAIFALMVLGHIESPELFLREMLRILKPKGGFYFITPNSNQYFGSLSFRVGNWKLSVLLILCVPSRLSRDCL